MERKRRDPLLSLRLDTLSPPCSRYIFYSLIFSHRGVLLAGEVFTIRSRGMKLSKGEENSAQENWPANSAEVRRRIRG